MSVSIAQGVACSTAYQHDNAATTSGVLQIIILEGHIGIYLRLNITHLSKVMVNIVSGRYLAGPGLIYILHPEARRGVREVQAKEPFLQSECTGTQRVTKPKH